MFSVDYPVGENSAGRAFLDALPVAPADREKVAHTNAERLLRLSV
jgi:predicted TIM-barrel fold metal-dependent hydrolase